jgi:hypothetical protein
MAKDSPDWRERLEEVFNRQEPFIGHPLLPIPLQDNKARTERVSSYVELEFLRFMEQYQARGGFRSTSEVLRRLAIVGAIAEGYQFTGDINEGRDNHGKRNTDQP